MVLLTRVTTIPLQPAGPCGKPRWGSDGGEVPDDVNGDRGGTGSGDRLADPGCRVSGVRVIVEGQGGAR